MRDVSRRTFWTGVALISAISLLWQIVFIFVWRQDYVVWGDAYFYYESGRQLADGVGWQNPLLYNDFGIERPAADHPPAYILFLGFWSWVGLDGIYEQMVLTSAFIGVGVVVMAGLAGREIAGRRVGLFAAASAAIYPAVWGWQGTLLSEPVAMIGVLGMIIVAYRYWHRPSLRLAAAMGAALTFATYARAELLLLSVVLIVPLALSTPNWGWARRWTALVVAGASTVALLAPWVAFNLSRFEEPVYVSEGYQITLATSTCDDTFYGPGTGYWSMRCPRLLLANAGVLDFERRDPLAESTSLDQSERSEILVDQSLLYLDEHLDRLPTVVVARWARVAGVWKPLSQTAADAFLEGRNHWVTKLAQGSWYVFFALAIAGILVTRRRGETILPLIAPLIVIFITVTITFGQSRYRASIEPAVAVMAAIAAEAVWSWFRGLRDDPEDTLPSPGE